MSHSIVYCPTGKYCIPCLVRKVITHTATFFLSQFALFSVYFMNMHTYSVLLKLTIHGKVSMHLCKLGTSACRHAIQDYYRKQSRHGNLRFQWIPLHENACIPFLSKNSELSASWLILLQSAIYIELTYKLLTVRTGYIMTMLVWLTKNINFMSMRVCKIE